MQQPTRWPTADGARTDGGTYLLIVRLAEAAHLRVGALGAWTFAPGWYVYAGSATRGLRARLDRHARRRKPLRWHIDYLTTAPGARVVGAVLVPGAAAEGAGLGECELNRLAGGLVGGTVPMPGFGASDCRGRCPAHLWYSSAPVTPEGLAPLVSPEATALSPLRPRRRRRGRH